VTLKYDDSLNNDEVKIHKLITFKFCMPE